MKKVKFNQAKEPDKSSIYTNAKNYSLSLGFGIKLSSKNKRSFNSAVYHINEDLTEILYQINAAYVFCFTEYRLSWFYLQGTQFRVSQKADEYNSEINRLFNLLSDRNGWSNGNYFAFKYFYLIIEDLDKWMDELIELRHRKRQFIEVRHLKRKQKEIASIKFLLEDIGKSTN